MNKEKANKAEVNLKEVLTDCMEKKDLLLELVKLFKANISEFRTNTETHLKNKDIKGVGFASHKIKSSLKMLRIKGLLSIATQMDAICKNDGDLTHLDFLFNQFLVEYPAVESSIDKQLKNL